MIIRYHCQGRRNLYLKLTLLVTIFFIAFKLFFNSRDDISCYRSNAKTLPNITDFAPRKGKSIFFHETSCKSASKGKIVISARQACAVESAARLNPSLDVYLLYTSPGVFKFEGDESDNFLKVLLSYQNVNIMHLDYGKYVSGTPVEFLYEGGKIEDSRYPISHASDVLRYLTLWKYGGIYLDLDLVIMKSLEDLPPNFTGLQSQIHVAAGAIGFEATGSGHEMAETCLNDLREGFDGSNWGNNGPGVITRLLERLCETPPGEQQEKRPILAENCQEFTLYPPDIFYPVRYEDWYMYFDENYMESVLDLTKNSMAIHVWNKFSASTRVPITSNVPYLHFARQFCPNIVEYTRDFF